VRYNVSISGCQTVMTNAGRHAEKYEGIGNAFSTALQGAATSGQSGIVASALQGYMEKSFTPAVSSIGTLTGNAFKGLNDALTYINQGDESMAQQSLSSFHQSAGAGSDAPRGGAPAA
jgi:hypothetical protein